jgi:hypothetical protein
MGESIRADEWMSELRYSGARQYSARSANSIMWLQRRRNQSRCLMCGSTTTGWRCRTCLIKIARARRAYVKLKAAGGRCANCSRAAVPGKTTCKTCAEGIRISAKRRKSARRQSGACYECSSSAVPGRSRCQKHLEQSRITQARRAAVRKPKNDEERLIKLMRLFGKKICERAYGVAYGRSLKGDLRRKHGNQ